MAKITDAIVANGTDTGIVRRWDARKRPLQDGDGAGIGLASGAVTFCLVESDSPDGRWVVDTRATASVHARARGEWQTEVVVVDAHYKRAKTLADAIALTEASLADIADRVNKEVDRLAEAAISRI
jgi:hypothetical protein